MMVYEASAILAFFAVFALEQSEQNVQVKKRRRTRVFWA